MSNHYFDIKFVTLGQLSTEIYNGFIKCHEYSNKFIFISAHIVKVICLSIALISSL